MIELLQRHRLVALADVALFALDQVNKADVVQTLALGSSWPGDGVFRITHIGNTGSAFGLFDGQNLVLTLLSVLGIGVLVLFYRSHPSPGLLVRLSLGLMLAGAFGNLTDRLMRGYVTDFIDIGPWYIFNVADASIVTGVIILAVTIVRAEPAPAAAEVEPPELPEESGAGEPVAAAESAPAAAEPEPLETGEPVAAAESPNDDHPAA